MDAPFCHICDRQRNFTPNTLQCMSNTKEFKSWCSQHYPSQCLSRGFAPIVANSLENLGCIGNWANTLHLFWNLACHPMIMLKLRQNFHFTFHIPITPPSLLQQKHDHQLLCGLKYHENHLSHFMYALHSIITRIIGQTFNFTCSPDYSSCWNILAPYIVDTWQSQSSKKWTKMFNKSECLEKKLL